MTQTQQLDVIDLKGAANDDVTFLGMAFNTLSSTINNLMGIFRKFTNKDIVIKAYKERMIRLEGSRKELTCLFTDIKRFTYMTETLGTDIITLLNLHYDRAIREIINEDGIIGSIIGDALLAVYGVFEDSEGNKSYQAIESAYMIQVVAKELRKKMQNRKKAVESKKGDLNDEQVKVYKAVLIQVGVGIDGGLVFYGNIGSHERMTNTVIGDNVNSASRLEGLTRIYQVPVIVSEYVKDDVENNVKNSKYRFIELDQVQVKGKTIGKKIYWPVNEEWINEDVEMRLQKFTSGLAQYYEGNWEDAYDNFLGCELLPAQVFLERTKSKQCPEGWTGIWTMTTK